MPFQIIRGDITKLKCDAIVNAANNSLLGGGGVDGAIHAAAGPGLLEECRTLGGCETGKAKATKAYNLPCKYVIHTVGPVWMGGAHGERELLASCYRESLALAQSLGCSSVAFPMISTGVYGYPGEEAMKVALEEVTSFLLGSEDMLVYLVVFGKGNVLVSKKLLGSIEEFIDDNYVEAARQLDSRLFGRRNAWFEDGEKGAPLPLEPDGGKELEDMLESLDETFSQMLLRKIDEKGMTDPECYKKANIDKKLFSKIRGNAGYKPKKATALAFAVALELSLEETRELLMKAGYALSPCSKFDLIIEYFILHRLYDVAQINCVLYSYGQPLLGY